MNEQTRNDMVVLLEQHFAIQVEPTDLSDDVFSHFEQALIERILWLMDHDWDKLMSSLYRIDVDEKLVQAAFKEHGTAHAPEYIARMIVKRLLKKAESWQKWREENP